MGNIPEKIYLQIGEIDDLDGVTWCQDKINRDDVEYVSSSFLKSKNKKLQRQLNDLKKAVYSNNLVNAKRILNNLDL